MIGPDAFNTLVIVPTCTLMGRFINKSMDCPSARVQLLAIGLQESGLEHRRQIDSEGNPIHTLARGWYQFEEGGGVVGVMTHPATAAYAEHVCEAMCIPFNSDDIHEAIAWNGYLATFFARLLLWTDPAALPVLGHEDAAWDYYIRNWRPGKPHRETWSANYQRALQVVTTTQNKLSGVGEV